MPTYTGVASIISEFVGGFTEFVGGIGEGIASLFSQLFLETVGETTTLSTFGVWAIVILCIGLGITMLYTFIGLIVNRG